MTILTDFGYLHLSLKKLYSDFSYTLAYVTLKYERNQIFHPCRDMFDFYGQALISTFHTSNVSLGGLWSKNYTNLSLVPSRPRRFRM